MKKTYIAPTADIFDFKTAGFVADTTGGVINTSTGGVDEGWSNKRQNENDESASNMIWNNWE